MITWYEYDFIQSSTVFHTMTKTLTQGNVAKCLHPYILDHIICPRCGVLYELDSMDCYCHIIAIYYATTIDIISEKEEEELRERD